MCSLWLMSFANNVQISNLSLDGPQTLSFDLSWEHAWNFELRSAVPHNNDAVWVFVKFQDADKLWKHVLLDTTQLVQQVDSPLVVSTPVDGLGVFIHLDINTLYLDTAATRVTLQLQTVIPSDAYGIKVFGIEMVAVNSGGFYVGDSVSYNTLGRGNDHAPLLILSEDAINIGNGANELSDTLGLDPPQGNIPAAYPKGFNAFYCMKYEISQEQYADFLNTLTYTQQEHRTATSPESPAGTWALNSFVTNRNGLKIGTPGNSANNTPAVYVCDENTGNAPNSNNDGQNRACNYLSWADVAAFLDWAALRPMTELEFEKAARGTNPPVHREFAWGTPYIVDANTLTNDGTPDETVTDSLPPNYGLGSHGYNGPQGPLRCGFAANDTSDRLRAGAGLNGVMELSGNLWEQVVNTTTRGLQYTGLQGDGTLDANGNADVANWPLEDGTGAGHKGGAWNSGIQLPFRDLAVSDRFYITLAPINRRNTAGGRGVRNWIP